MNQAVHAAESSRRARAAQRQAPAFTVGVTTQPLIQGLVALLAAISVSSAVTGLALREAQAWWLLSLVPLASAWAWHSARVVPRQLHWDGQCWRLAQAASFEPGPEVRIEVLADMDSFLLLRADGRLYLPLLARALPAHWGQLRATLYSAHVESPQG